jgi:hypothetical protein
LFTSRASRTGFTTITFGSLYAGKSYCAGRPDRSCFTTSALFTSRTSGAGFAAITF